MKNFQKSSVNVGLVVIIILVIVSGYFTFMNKPQAANVPVVLQPIGSPSITIISPNGREVYVRGESVPIKWIVAKSNDVVRLVLIPGDIQITSFGNAAANFTSPYLWTIPASVVPGSYKIKTSAYDEAGSVPTLRGSDSSDDYFTIQ